MTIISQLLTENTNIIEIYVMNKNKDSKTTNKYDIYLNDAILDRIKSKFKLTRETTMVYFNRNNLYYAYDLSNDSQYVYLRKLENNLLTNKQNYDFYGIAFNEMKMPTHTFACTNDIDNKVEYKIQEFKINNRISLIIKNNNLYIYYKHSKEVDIEKTQEIINGIIKKILL